MLFLAYMAPETVQSLPPSPPERTKQTTSPTRTDPPTDVTGVEVTAPKLFREPDWSKHFNFDPRGVYAPSDVPYLRQRPTNGCKTMAGGSVSPAGEYGVASGIVCVKPF